ncbi:papain-like cysteine protease family protein [Marivita geojedonensis]|uniref:papain-like cysteine protease family protein n=1 Tax=Marivita geojedonensis TaxID=1123756 RepID=UPI000D4D078E|nr:papain-like cysteine protease family protein [Marivita geojedonensis]PRY76683.1 putative peptidoglycan binding protein [Marivita geojedonensis]
MPDPPARRTITAILSGNALFADLNFSSQLSEKSFLAMALSSPRFRWNSRLQQAEKNNPALRRPESGLAVRLIQKAMIDLGIDPMTNSIKRHGTVDGVFGNETVQAVKKYQRSKHLGDDGVVGKNTMGALDVDLPNGTDSLPPLPSDRETTGYVVPGAISIFDQVAGRHPMGCWAYSYTMMLSWKRQESLAPNDAMADLGDPWLTRYNTNAGLSWGATAQFYRVVGMQYEPMQSYPLTEWSDLLRAYGPLTIHGVNNSLSGGHVRILYGVTGDGTMQRTYMLIIDPWNGRSYQEPYEKFLAKYEGGGAQAARTAQIAHW